MKKVTELKKLGLPGSFAIYIPAAILMFCLTKYLIPWLSKVTGQETIFFWFLVAGFGIFLPLVITGILILKAEGQRCTKKLWIDRLRFSKITIRDMVYALTGMIVVGLLSLIIMKGLEIVIGKFEHSPSFISMEPLTPGRYWLLLVWFPYWILNIMGEEFLWRGVMLPRQELAFGKYTWIVHAIGWGIFHIAFGWKLILTLIPLIFILSYIVQKTKNTWIGVIMHGGINGPSFIAICFGLIS